MVSRSECVLTVACIALLGAGCESSGDGDSNAGGSGGTMSAAGTGATGHHDDAGTSGTGGAGGTGGSGEMVYSMEPLVAREEIGEKCYEFTSHGGQTLDDTSKYMVQKGERYVQFYFDIPWGDDEVAVRFGARFDNVTVLHHWLLFSAKDDHAAGSSETLEGAIGVLRGQESGQTLLAGWAIGGSSMELPDDVGLQLPTIGKINAQWHTYNLSDAEQADGSAVQVCTVPKASRTHLAGMTWLGTEDIPGPTTLGQGMEQGEHSFSGTCENDSGEDISIVMFWPHMHRIGINMASSINGEEVFNQPFYPTRQIHYDQRPPLVLKPGDKITSTCTYNNTTGRKVGYGESTDDEMCYQFVWSYPVGALDNGVSSLIGATNTCWDD